MKNLLHLADVKYAETLERYVLGTIPQLVSSNFQYRTSPLPFYALSNLLTLFSHDMPTLPLIQHVFDYLLCRPPIAVVYLATAVRGFHLRWEIKTINGSLFYSGYPIKETRYRPTFAG